MRLKSEKEEEKEIRRLKEILFPKNKQTYQNALNSFSSNQLLETQTRRQLTLKPQNHNTQTYSHHQRLRNNKKTKANYLEMRYDSQQSDQINQLEYYQLSEHQPIDQKPQILIKDQISKLKQQISTMLQKWGDEQHSNYDQDSHEYQRKDKVSLPTYQAISQQLEPSSSREDYTRRHYLQNVNKISEHLQKYNSYMYGIKQAAEEVISVIPVDRNQHTFPNPHLRTYKLYYLALLLTNYFVTKIQHLKVKRLRYAFGQIYKASDCKKDQKQTEQKRRSLNKGNFMFLRKNFLDKAFKKWRFNCELIKFNEMINPPIQASLSQNQRIGSLQESGISQFQHGSKPLKSNETKNGELLAAQFILKNVLYKEKVVDFLQDYLLNATKVSISSFAQKQLQSHMHHDVQIVLFDQQNNEMFSFIDQSDYLYKEMEGKIVESRLYNVLDSIRDDWNEENGKIGAKRCFRKYSFQLKNSLTRMCIDCEKTIKIPEMKRNEVYLLEVDASVNQQIWIKTSKTQRSSRVEEISEKKAFYITEQVFYEQQSMLDSQFYYFDNPGTKISAIFYPIIHEESLIGLVRQYIYHTVPISLQNFEVSYEDLEFVAKSIFTTFELSYSFEGLRKEHDIVERRYALKVLRMLKKVQDEIDSMINRKYGDGLSEEMLTIGIMETFVREMSSFLKGNRKQADQPYDQVALAVYKLMQSPDENGRKVKIIICIEGKEQKQQFTNIFGSSQFNEREIDDILNEFYIQSKHKDSHISIIKKHANSSSQMGFILLIKTRPSIHYQPLYFVFLFDEINKQSIQKSSISISQQRLVESLPPLELLVDIMSKFSEIYNRALVHLKNCKLQNQQNHTNLIIQNKHQLRSRMHQFYLESIKMHLYNMQKDKIKNLPTKSYLKNVKEFIAKCMRKFVDQLQSLQLPTDLQEKDLIICNAIYLAQISLPKTLVNNFSKRPHEDQKLYVVIDQQHRQGFGEKMSQSEQQIDSQAMNQQDKCKVLNEEQYMMWVKAQNLNIEQIDEGQSKKELVLGKSQQAKIIFKYLKTKIRIQRPEKDLQASQESQNRPAETSLFSLKLTNDQITKIIQYLIESFISFTQQQLIKEEGKNKIQNQQNRQDQSNVDKKASLQPISKEIELFKDNIKQKVFEIYCKKGESSNQNDEQSQNVNKKPNFQTNLADLVEVLNQIVKSICHRHPLQKQYIQVLVNSDALRHIINEAISAVPNSQEISLKSEQQKVISEGLLSTYRQFIKLINEQCNLPQKLSKEAEKGLQNENLTLLGQLVQKSEGMKSQINLLVNRKLIKPNQASVSEIAYSSYLSIQSKSTEGFDQQLIKVSISQSQLSNKSLPYIKQSDSSLSVSLLSLIQCAINQYISVFNWKYDLYRNKQFARAFDLLTHGKSNPKRNQSNENEPKSCKTNMSVNQGLLLYNLSFSFNKLHQFTSNSVFKGSKLIKISSIISNKSKSSTFKYLIRWQSIKNDIKLQQTIKILKQKIVSNPEKQSQKIQKLIDAVGKNIIYGKILGRSLTRINFFAKHNRIADFSSFKLKCLENALEQLNQAFVRGQNKEMKRFFRQCVETRNGKRREQFFRHENSKLFIVQLQNSSIYRRKVTCNVNKAFNKIKKQSGTKSLSMNQINQLAQVSRHSSVDQQITQSKSMQQVTSILCKQFPSYDIWVRPIKKSQGYILLSSSQPQASKQEQLVSARNLSFDESSIMASRINSITNRSKVPSSYESAKQDIYLKYAPDLFSFLETSQTIFVSKNTSVHTDLLSSGPLNLSQASNSFSPNISFKQKDKLHSLAKSLSQFFSNFKIQFHIKLTYFDSIFQTIKLKRFSCAIKKWRRYNDNLRLLATSQLTDKIYELNVESQSLKDKLKMQQKQIHDQKTQYNKLLKKQTEHQNRIEKYLANIEILGRMLGHYQTTQKQEEKQMRSAAKSSKKFNKNISRQPLISLDQLDEEELSIVGLTLTKWRQVNLSDKVRELRAKNKAKQSGFMASCLNRCWKIMSRTVKLDTFQKILSYSIYVEELKQQKLRKERLRVERHKREQEESLQKEQAERQSYERKHRQIEELRKQIEQRKQNQAAKNKWKYETMNLSGSKNITPSKITPASSIEPIKDVSDTSSYFYDDSQSSQQNDYSMESVEKRSITHSLAEQLEGEFNELNRRLVTFQKNNASPGSECQEVSHVQYFNSYETSQHEKQPSCSELQFEQKGLEEYKAPNNTVDLMTLIPEKPTQAKMTEQEKIRFELERMKMKKPQFNKENLTVTKEEYEKVNGGGSYKLGGKTLRFLKRMGKLEGADKQ